MLPMDDCSDAQAVGGARISKRALARAASSDARARHAARCFDERRPVVTLRVGRLVDCPQKLACGAAPSQVLGIFSGSFTIIRNDRQFCRQLPACPLHFGCALR